jgi:hypothetical protein
MKDLTYVIDDFRGEISLMGEIKGPPNFYWANFLYCSGFFKVLLVAPYLFKKKICVKG